MFRIYREEALEQQLHARRRQLFMVFAVGTLCGLLLSQVRLPLAYAQTPAAMPSAAVQAAPRLRAGDCLLHSAHRRAECTRAVARVAALGR